VRGWTRGLLLTTAKKKFKVCEGQELEVYEYTYRYCDIVHEA